MTFRLVRARLILPGRNLVLLCECIPSMPHIAAGDGGADGHSYERAFIQRWLSLGRRAPSDGRTSPKTNAVLSHTTLIPNLNLRNMIHAVKDRMPAIQREQMWKIRHPEDLEAIISSLMEDQGKLALDPRQQQQGALFPHRKQRK
ncbi:unnamed protein product [Polarella glacialis]|uniref:U-box domain-containing protein n=1 Tax=Polarella glacialis TaxID=89957 RepID=A0A813LKN7_POLGL|nr:unnamed protein product [Polarella glacialis]